jgi:catalase
MEFQPKAEPASQLEPSPQLSILQSTRTDTIRTRRVALLIADGCDDASVNALIEALTSQGAQAKVVAPRLGYVRSDAGNELKVHFSLFTASSVLFDAIYLPGGTKSVAGLLKHPQTIEFVREAYRHCKAIGASNDAAEILASVGIGEKDRAKRDQGVLISSRAADPNSFSDFLSAVAQHRIWTREPLLRPDLRQSEPAA